MAPTSATTDARVKAMQAARKKKASKKVAAQERARVARASIGKGGGKVKKPAAKK